MNILEAIKTRRSIYNLNKDITISDDEIKEILVETLNYVPSAFNSHSTRIVLLLDKNHEEFWNIVKETLKKMVVPEQFKRTEHKIDTSFASGYGTVLFFEDENVVKNLQEQFPNYADYFPSYSLQSSGMHQYAVWTLFAARKIGASLQHYQPLIDEAVAEKWDIPKSWTLISQMPFGGIAKEPDTKTNADINKVLKIFK